MSNKKATTAAATAAATAATGTKRVIATAKGFYGCLREVGAEFDVGANETGKWFTEVKTLEKPATDEKLDGGVGDLV